MSPAPWRQLLQAIKSQTKGLEATFPDPQLRYALRDDVSISVVFGPTFVATFYNASTVTASETKRCTRVF